MKKSNLIIFLLFDVALLLICACSSSNKVVKNVRTLSLTNKYVALSPDSVSVTNVPESFSEGGFTSWYCRDSYTRNIIFEFGFLTYHGTNIGFVLYDGTDNGAFTIYYRNGLDHRWDWDQFSFVITPEGEGIYYDFHNVPIGEKTTAKQVYNVIKRKK